MQPRRGTKHYKRSRHSCSGKQAVWKSHVFLLFLTLLTALFWRCVCCASSWVLLWVTDDTTTVEQTGRTSFTPFIPIEAEEIYTQYRKVNISLQNSVTPSCYTQHCLIYLSVYIIKPTVYTSNQLLSVCLIYFLICLFEVTSYLSNLPFTI